VVLEELLRRYAEPHRAYHDLAHVLDCLDELDAARSIADDPDAVEMAIWFHDAIYDPGSADNEDRSARLAADRLAGAGMGSDFIGRVAALIAATRHDRPAEGGDAGLLCDVDLAILGKDPARFDRYEAAIGKEYAWVPPEVFAARRAAVLASFLARDSIYATAAFRERYERRARENLERSLRKLYGRVDS